MLNNGDTTKSQGEDKSTADSILEIQTKMEQKQSSPFDLQHFVAVGIAPFSGDEEITGELYSASQHPLSQPNLRRQPAAVVTNVGNDDKYMVRTENGWESRKE